MRPSRSLLLAALTLSTGAWAESIETETGSGFRFTSTDHAIFSNTKDPGDPDSKPTNLFMHENSLRGEMSVFSMGLQFTNQFSPGGPSELNRPFLLDKKTLALSSRDWEVRVGDSHQELGRGIALSLYKDPTFGLDTTLEGVSARYRPSGLDARVFGGRLNALRAPVALNPQSSGLEDREVLMTGTSLQASVAPEMKLGGHYLLAMNRPLTSARFDKRWQALGASVSQDGIFDSVDLYLESNALLTRSLEGGEKDLPTGYGSYLAASWSAAPWKVRLEGKDYRHYFFDFRRPPTLEEDIVVSLNTQDVSAAKLYAERRFDEAHASLFASYMVGDDRTVKAPLHHTVVGGKFLGPWNIPMELKTGYRAIGEQSDMLHASLKGKIKTGRGEYLELGVRKQYSRLNLNFRPTDEDRNCYDMSYTFSEAMSANAGYEYLPSNFPEVGKHFLNAGGTYKWNSLTAKAFLGQTSGGTLCSGGVCRKVPAYTGAMLETTYVF